MVKLKSLVLRSHHDLVDHYGISVSQMTTDMFPLSQKLPGPFLIHDITGFVTRSTRRVPLVKQELLTLPEHMSSPPVFSGVPVTRSLVLCVCFVDRCLSFWPLCCLSCDLRVLFTHLASSNSLEKQIYSQR